MLGSGQDGGVAQIGCECRNCGAVRRGERASRSAASIAIIHDGQAILVDTAPDIRQQWSLIGAPVAAVTWTHAHMGHVAGASQLGREGPDLRVPGIGTAALLAHVQAAAPHLSLAWQTLAPGATHGVAGLALRFHAIHHRAESSDTVAIEVQGKRRVLYLPDTDAWDDAVEAAIARLQAGDLLLFDATFWSRDELPHRDIALVPHPFVQETLERLHALVQQGVRVVLTHLNHTNPLCDPASPQHADVAGRGIVVAHDGLRLAL